MKKIPELNCIVLIDDDEPTNYMNNMTIEEASIDVHVEICYNAQDGLDYLSCKGKYSSETEYPQPGIIFLDINMPGKSGWDFLIEYADLPNVQKARVVIAMLTTSLNPDEDRKAAGFKDIKEYYRKPLTVEMLMDIISSYFDVPI